MKAASILDTIGNTPHVRLSRMFPDHEVWVKCERANPGGSIKDRIGIAMIEAAEANGSLKPGGTIIEPTSGNTGVGLAMAAAVKGYTLVLVMPESMSIERRRLMLAYGATFDLTPREKGMKGAIERARELVEQTARQAAELGRHQAGRTEALERQVAALRAERAAPRRARSRAAPGRPTRWRAPSRRPRCAPRCRAERSRWRRRRARRGACVCPARRPSAARARGR